MCTHSINTYFKPISSKIYNKLLNFTATFFNIRYCKILQCGNATYAEHLVSVAFNSNSRNETRV